MTWSSEMAQFRFRTRKILWLGSYAVPLPYNKFSTTWKVLQFRFHTRALTLSPAAPTPHKEYPVTWSSAVSLPHKEYTMSRSSAVLLLHTEQSVTWSSSVSHNILWLEFPHVRKKRRHLKFRTSASAWEHYFSLKNLLSFNHPSIS